jgi:hypothetical protein
LPEDLLGVYRVWRKEQKLLLDLLDEHDRRAMAPVEDAGNPAGSDAAFTEAAGSARHKPWQVRAHASYGLGVGHGKQSKDKAKDVLPVLSASAWRRDVRPVGAFPRKSVLKASVPK